MTVRHLFTLIPTLAAAIPITALLLLYGVSEVRLRAHDMPPGFDDPIPATVEALARGERIARTRGCHECHGTRLEGRDRTEEWPGHGRVVAPNLARYAREHTASEVERAVRHGIDARGRALWLMPSHGFARLRDEDVAALISYLRQHPVSTDSLQRRYTTIEVRWAVATQGAMDNATWVRAVPPLQTTPERDGAVVHEGEYLAMTSCTECHGPDLRGARVDSVSAPDLAVAATYSRAEFERLMRRGVNRSGNADLPTMSRTARSRFLHWTAPEVDALHAFLTTLPARPVASGVFWRAGP